MVLFVVSFSSAHLQPDLQPDLEKIYWANDDNNDKENDII